MVLFGLVLLFDIDPKLSDEPYHSLIVCRVRVRVSVVCFFDPRVWLVRLGVYGRVREERDVATNRV